MFKNILKRIRLFFHQEKESYFALYEIMGFFPKDLSFYDEALLHKSSVREKTDSRFHHNERLEFLGDAILNAVVADIVFKRFQNRNEGFLTTTRSKIVKRETLDILSNELGLHKLLVASMPVWSPNSHVLGNALEAFIGAIYLDQGYRKTRRFIEEKVIYDHLNIDTLAKKEVNFKSRLLEWSQKHRVDLQFNLLEYFKDYEHNPVFQSQASLNGLLAGIGTGYSKKESEQQASQMALKKIRSDKDFYTEIINLSPSPSKYSHIQ